MRIVLLGATGFVGHHLLPRLADAGHECLVLTRSLTACRELSVIPKLRLVNADIQDAAGLATLFEGADAVINMVGILNEKGRNGSGFRKAHVDVADNVIDACRKSGVSRVLQVSALNAGKGESHYLVTKGEAEEHLRAAADLDVTIFQPSVIFGPGDSFFNRFATLLRISPVLPLACPESRMQPVYIGDVTDVIARSIDDFSTFGRTYELAGPGQYTLRELVAFTADVCGLKRTIIGLPNILSRLQGKVMDFVPGKPFSSDNFRSLQTDNISTDNALPRFGISPASIECIVPDYLTGSRHQRHLFKLRQHAGR